MEADFPLAHNAQSRFGKRLHSHVPLIGEVRLDDGMAAVTLADIVRVGFHLHKETVSFQVLNDLLARREAIRPRILCGHFSVQKSFFIENVDLLQIVALADQEVVGIVSRGNFHHPGAKCLIDVIIGNDWQLAPDQREHCELPHEVFVPDVPRVDSDRGIA